MEKTFTKNLMAVFQLIFSYVGTDFHGWQNQPGCRTVQQVMEEVLRSLFRDPELALTGCGRTDAGVHALRMTASFRTENPIPEEELFSLLEKRLPHDIQIREVESRPDHWNAHQAACGKSYLYAVHHNGYALFLKDRVWNWPETAYPEKLFPFLNALQGEHDFQNFTNDKPETASTVRTVYRAELVPCGPFLTFHFSGNGFLRKMIRRIMGLLREANRGSLSPEEFERTLSCPGFRPFPEAVAPPDGLYLNRVFYRENEWKEEPSGELPFLQ